MQGKWSDMQVLITQEDKLCFGSLGLQNIWSKREELDLQHCDVWKETTRKEKTKVFLKFGSFS